MLQNISGYHSVPKHPISITSVQHNQQRIPKKTHQTWTNIISIASIVVASSASTTIPITRPPSSPTCPTIPRTGPRVPPRLKLCSNHRRHHHRYLAFSTSSVFGCVCVWVSVFSVFLRIVRVRWLYLFFVCTISVCIHRTCLNTKFRARTPFQNPKRMENMSGSGVTVRQKTRRKTEKRKRKEWQKQTHWQQQPCEYHTITNTCSFLPATTNRSSSNNNRKIR